MSINLLPHNEKNLEGLGKYKPKVYLVSTVVLIVYVVAGAAISGWWFFLNNRETVYASKIAALSAQIRTLSNVEVIVRQVEDRVKFIDKSLSGRVLAFDELGKISSDLNITGWSYIPGTKQIVTISGAKLSDIEAYADSLKTKFTSVTIDTTSRKSPVEWEATLSNE